HVPGVVRHRHLNEQVAREEPLRGHDLLAAAHLDDVLGRNQNLADLVVQPVGLHPLPQRLRHLALETGIGVHDEPLLRARDFGHAAAPNTRYSDRSAAPRTRSSPQRYTPKNTDVRITTTVVA